MQELKQEKIAAELELLKSQVQPHFSFNMLNNIYVGAFKNSPETAQQILKLSNLIEYSLYDSKKEKVPLQEELDYISNYVDLQKIRIGDRLDVSFNIFDNISGFQISPLLLLPIIENCFKHGVNKSITQAWIRMDISAKERTITFKYASINHSSLQSIKYILTATNVSKSTIKKSPSAECLNKGF